MNCQLDNHPLENPLDGIDSTKVFGINDIDPDNPKFRLMKISILYERWEIVDSGNDHSMFPQGNFR